MLVIGKSKNPHAFKRVKQLPVKYRANKKAWMTADLFTEWIRNVDKTMRRQKCQILMVVDNCPAHPNINDLENVKLAFLPPNTTLKMQPCDAGIINSMKAYYRKKLISQIIDAYDEGKPFSFDLLDALFTLCSAWVNDVTKTTIRNCFHHASFCHDSITDADESVMQVVRSPEKTFLSVHSLTLSFSRLTTFGTI